MGIRFTKRRRKKRLTIWMLLAAAAGAACTGCAGREEVCCSEEQLPVELSFSWWGSEVTHEYTLHALELYETHNQGINVKTAFSSLAGYEKGIHMAGAAGQMADVVQLDYAWLDDGMVREGLLDIYEVADLIFYQNFSGAELAIGEADGKIYAVPQTLDMPVILWNEEILAACGAEIPSTWDELFDLAQILKKEGKFVLDAQPQMQWLLALNYMEQRTGMPLTGEDSALLAGGDELQELIEFGCKLADGGTAAGKEGEGFTLGKCAGTVVWLNDTDFFKELDESGWSDKTAAGLCLKTTGGKLDSWYVKPSVMYAINRETEIPRESAEFVHYLLSGRDMIENQKLDKGVPVSRVARKALLRTDVITQTQYEVSEKDSGIERLEPLEPVLLEEELVLAYMQCLQQVTDGKATGADAAGALYVSLDKILRKE